MTWKSLYFPGLTIVENLQNALAKVDFVILLILSDLAEDGKNVGNLYFEMGLIFGMGKPMLTLVEKGSTARLPAELTSIMHLNCDPNNLEASFPHRNWAAHSLEYST